MTPKGRVTMEGNAPFGKSSTSMFRWSVLILLFFASILFHTMIRTKSTHTILSISKSQARLEKVESYRKSLELELARLTANRRITGLARKLGLRPYTLNQTIYLKKGNN